MKDHKSIYLTPSNGLTLIRFLIIGYIFFYCGGLWALMFVLCAIGMLSDYYDGWLARRYSWKSAIGAIMDPIADKLLVVVILYHINQDVAFVVTILELIGAYYSARARGGTGHLIANGSKEIAFLQMATVLVFILIRVDVSWIMYLQMIIFHSGYNLWIFSSVLQSVEWLQNNEEHIYFMLYTLSLVRIFMYRSIYKTKK